MTFEIVRDGSRLHVSCEDGFYRRSFTPFSGSKVETFDTESDALNRISSSRVFYHGCSVVKTNYLFTDDYFRKSLQHVNQRPSVGLV